MSDAENQDKTIFNPREKAQAPTQPDDKTRIIPSAAQAKPRQSSTKAPGDALNSEFPEQTHFAPKAKLTNDKTAIKPDLTRLNKPAAPGVLGTGAASRTILKGRFVLEDLLGAGGMGVVYKAKDLLKIEAQDRDPYVAIKVLTDEFKAHPEAFIALQRESRKTQRIAHPNIVTVYDFDRDGDTVFMTMEYLDGKPLDKLISQYRSVGLPFADVYKILEGMSAALVYAHGQNIIHSDFKPGNIFVSNKGIAKVIDFGIARAVAKVEHREESVDDKTVFDAANLGALTPAYASLEMLQGKTPDVRDDIYALGCIAYELYTGIHPFNRIHADEAKRQKLKPKRIAGLKKNQWRAIERALAFDREDRIQTVELFWNEFSRKPKTYWGGALIGLTLVVAAGAYYQFKPEPTQAISEDQVRTEIEQKLRLEMMQKTLAELHAQPSFSPEWEAQLWQIVPEFRQLLGKSDPWLAERENTFLALYLDKIKSAIESGDLANAEVWLASASRYALDNNKIDELANSLALAKEAQRIRELELEQQKAQQAADQELVQKERNEQQQKNVAIARQNSEFDTALGNVNRQLACKSVIDMRDFEIAVTKLRSLNMTRYQKEEGVVIVSLAGCIQKLGATFPDRADAIRRHALRLFPGNSVLEKISIAPKDPCSSTLAGLGSRGMGSTCKDKLVGATKAPVLVVVPAKGSIKSFAIGKFELSTDEVNEFCQQTKQCPVATTDPLMPAANISLDTATAYLKWLTEKSGHQYRLPTLAEWQYAARATNATPDPNRNCKLNSRGIQKGNATNKITLGQQNSWGLVNHLGNLSEWALEPGGRAVAVGGSYDTEMAECNFNNKAPHSGSPDAFTGVRIVRALK
jgi:serine/threonine protein kinase